MRGASSVSIFDYFGTASSQKKIGAAKQKKLAEEINSVTEKWSLENARQLYEKHKYLRMANPSQKPGASKGATRAAAAPAELPLRLKDIVTVRMRMKKPITPTLYLGFLPLNRLMEVLREINGVDGKVTKVFGRNVFTEFEDGLKEYAVRLTEAGIPGLHIPIRLAGSTSKLQAMLKVYGLDFGSIIARVNNESQLPRYQYNSYNVEFIDIYAYHGAGKLEGTKDEEFAIEPNMGDVPEGQLNIYSEQYFVETDINREKSSIYAVVTEDGQNVMLSKWIIATSAIIRLPYTEQEKLRRYATTDIEGRTVFKETGRGGVAYAEFLRTIRNTLKKGENFEKLKIIVGPKVVDGVVKEGEIQTTTRKEGITDKLNKYVDIPGFTFKLGGIDTVVEEGVLVFPAFKGRGIKKDSKAKESGESKDDPNYDPKELINTFVKKLEGAVDDQVIDDIRDTMKRNLQNMIAKRKKAQEAKGAAKEKAQVEYVLGEDYEDEDEIGSAEPEEEGVVPEETVEEDEVTSESEENDEGSGSGSE